MKGNGRLLGVLVGLILVASVTATIVSTAVPAAGADSTMSLAADAQVLAVGDSAHLTASFTRSGTPLAGATVEWMVLTGPNIGTGGTAASDESGSAVFSYEGSGGAGIDQVRAKAIDPDGDLVASEPVVVNWVPTLPATLELSQASDPTPVGTTEAVVATVRDGGGGPVPGLEVLLDRDGAVMDDYGLTDAAGQASFAVTADTAGVETIRAEVRYTSPLVEATLSKTWTPIGALVLAPDDATKPVGDERQVTVTATDAGGAPVGGAEVELTVKGANPQSTSLLTDAAGVVGFTYTGAVAGVDAITAAFTDPDGNRVESEQVIVGWVAPTGTSLSLTSLTPEGTSGLNHTFYAVAGAAGAALSGAQTSVRGGGSPPYPFFANTDERGLASFQYVNSGPATETFTASFENGGTTVASNPVTVQFRKGYDLYLAAYGTALVGTEYTATLSVTGPDSAPVAGAPVDIGFFYGSPNALQSTRRTTDAYGRISFTFIGFVPGGASIAATLQAPYERFASGGVTFTNSQITLDPSWQPVTVGTTASITAHLTSLTAPVDGVEVEFMVTSGPNGGMTKSAVTDSDGNATISYSSAWVGSDLFRATATVDGELVSATGASAWWIPAPTTIALALSPPTAVVNVGDTHTATATLTENSSPIADFEVHFEVTAGPNAGVTGSQSTDESGTASFTYTGTDVGVDTIVATSAVRDLELVSNEATVNWVAASPDLALALEPMADSGLLGSTHDMTATLTDGGSPLEGVEVTFTVTDGPNAGTTDTALSAADGTVSFAYTGDGGAGTDSIIATAMVGEWPVMSGTATMDWADVPAGPALSLAPEADSGPRGTMHALSATLTEGDSPVAGVEVGFEVTDGPQAGVSGNGVTDESGVATFEYYGDSAGVDTIVARATVGDSEVTSNEATMEWVGEIPAVVQLMPASNESPVGSEHRVDAIVTTADGMVVPDVTVTFTVVSGPHAGVSGTGVTTSTGTAWFDYTGTAAGTDTIVASVRVGEAEIASNEVTQTWTEVADLDSVHLRALWGPAGHRSLAYENGATLTAGDYVIDPATGTPEVIEGTGTLASASGSGDATIAFHLEFDTGRNTWGGTVEIDDPGAGFTAEIPVFAGPGRITRDGDTITGTLYGIKRLTIPMKCFELHFTIVDGGGEALPAPPAEAARGHLRFNGGHARWAPFLGIRRGDRAT